MSFPDHLLTLATLRLLTLTPLAATYTQSTAASTSTATATTSLHHHHQPQDRFHSVRSRPLHILTELTAAYLQLLGNAAKNHAEQAGRTLANALDAREAIADYGGTVDEIDEWARECQLDRGILSSNDALMNDAAGAAAAGGGGADGERAEAADLGALLKDTYFNQAYRQPTKIIEYAPLTDREAAVVDAVQQNQSLLPFLPYDLQQRVQQGQDDDTASSDDDEEDHPLSPASSSRGVSQPPPSYQEATASDMALSDRKREKLRARDNDYNENDLGENKENDDPLSFLPPFPDLDATHASLQTIVEDETGRIVKRARRALDANSNMANLSQARKNASIAWLRAVPYETSSLAEYEGGKFSVPSIKHDDYTHKQLEARGEVGIDGEANDDDDDLFNASSLPYFLETFNWVSLDYEQQGDQALLPLRHNNKRKRAATAIQSNILNPSDDSLSGSIPTLPPRYGKKQAGWIPYPPINPDISDSTEPGGKAIKPFPYPLNPFNSNLPNSITESIPNLILPHSSIKLLLSTPMYPRYSLIINSIKTLLESSASSGSGGGGGGSSSSSDSIPSFLFNRTTRMGPPGPLLENGSNGNYLIENEKPIIPGWPNETLPRMMGWNFDWEIGNELEDGIKERKNAGIQDFGIHKSSSSSSGNNNNNNNTSTTGESSSSDIQINGNTIKDEYKGPNFPPLPVRPIYDPHQALQQQKEQERREEEAEFQFQEVQEDRENDAALMALQLQQQQQQEEEQARQAQAQAEAHAQAQAKEGEAILAAAAAAAAATAASEREEAERQQEQQQQQGSTSNQMEQQVQAEGPLPQEVGKIDTQDRPKSLPKLSFSLKLGHSASSSSVPVNSTMTTESALLSDVPSGDVTPVDPSQVLLSDEAKHSISNEGQPVDQHSSLELESSGNTTQSGATMWTPGLSVEQDYRAPAADITSLSQPPIVRPADVTPQSPPASTTVPVQESSVPNAPIQSVLSPAPFGVTDTFSATEQNETELGFGQGMDASEGVAEGEEDAENEDEEDEEEDDLFDEVEVDDDGRGNGNDSMIPSNIDYSSSSNPPAAMNAGDSNGMHVEVEEMDM